MKNFTKQKINKNKIITLVSVGSYKVRVAICSFSFSSVEILGYGEKRQSRLDIVNNEINNIYGLYQTIDEAIKKAEFISGEKSEDIIINPFFSPIFYYSKNINYKYGSEDIELGNKDIYKIFEDIERNNIDSIFSEILRKFGFGKDDLNLILKNISNIFINDKNVKSLYGEKGSEIKIKVLNTFIPKINYEIIYDISNYLNKNIIKIVPEEYSIIKLGEKGKKIVFIDIGNSSTALAIKNEDESLVGALRLSIGIGDLLKDISKNFAKSRSEIIKRLDRTDLFKEEKKNFLLIFLDILVEGLSEILSGSICPNNFILVGGGANNHFIKEYLSQKDFNSLGIKMLKNINFMSVSIEEIKKIIGVEDILKLGNINIISQIITTKNVLSMENDIMEKSIQNSIEK